MINTTDNIILFTLSQDDLEEAVRDALGLASYGILDAYRLSDLDLGRVTTKSFQEVAFAKFVELKILPSADMVFDEAYVINALEIYQGRWEEYSEEQFYLFNGNSLNEEFVFKKVYARVMRQGIGVFLVALYALKAIILIPLYRSVVTIVVA
ncbi:hypothetical protein ACMX25_36555 [Caballeronia sp. 15715]|uniref:hypothetical protein n=1 Tax=Caballeronia sp. 15715 TaxID=3391030 RepID=UPI0039E61042